MYGTRKEQHLLFPCLVLISLASCLQGNLCNGNDYEVSPTCVVKKEISTLDGLITDLRNIRKEYQKCVSKCSKALFFNGSTNEYAKLDKGAQPVGDVSDGHGATGRGLDAMTSCFWIKTEKIAQEPAVLSYAVPERDNEFLIILHSLSIKIFFKDEYHTSRGPKVYTGIGVSDGKWHHVCITWKSSDGSVGVYKDGVLQKNKAGIITGQRIVPSGIWIIGQDQDSYGGDFQQKNAFHGSLTDVNVWSRVLGPSEISTLASKKCGLGIQGNYKAYKDFVPKGDVQLVNPSCCH